MYICVYILLAGMRRTICRRKRMLLGWNKRHSSNLQLSALMHFSPHFTLFYCFMELLNMWWCHFWAVPRLTHTHDEAWMRSSSSWDIFRQSRLVGHFVNESLDEFNVTLLLLLLESCSAKNDHTPGGTLRKKQGPGFSRRLYYPRDTHVHLLP